MAWECVCGKINEDTITLCDCGTTKYRAIQELSKKKHHKQSSYFNLGSPTYKEKGVKAGVGFCPFSWIEVTKPAGCLSSIFGGKVKVVSEPQICMTSRCQLWDSSANNCGLITKNP